MKEKKRKSVISIGIVSLLTIFVILLLTSFSLLIFSGAQTDSKLSLRAKESTLSFYEADALAEQTLMQLHEIYLSESEQTLKSAFESEGFTVSGADENGVSVYFELPYGIDKVFIAEIFFPFNNEEDIKRLKWQSLPEL